MSAVSDGATAGSPADQPARRLSAEDLSILSLENETVAGHTCKVIVLGGRIDPDRLREVITSRLDRAPELRTCLREVDGEQCWSVVPAVDLHEHVAIVDQPEPLDNAGLRATVARIFEERLDRARPLWKIDLVRELAGGGSVLIWRIHHALADGMTAMRIANATLWDDEPGPERVPANSAAVDRPRALNPQRMSRLRAVARETPQPWLRSPFDGHIGAHRAVAFTTLELEGLRRVAAACDGATVNDVVLTVVAGGLRRWLELHHGHLGAVRVKVPVSLHGTTDPAQSDSDQGNRDSFFCLDLPLGSSDPIARLRAISRSSRIRKQGHDAQYLDSLMRELGRSPRLRVFAEQVLAHPRSFALNVSNVRGPSRPVHVLDVPVHNFYSLAEIREHHALRVAVASLVDSLNFGLTADPTLFADVDQLAGGISAEAAELRRRLQPV